MPVGTASTKPFVAADIVVGFLASDGSLVRCSLSAPFAIDFLRILPMRSQGDFISLCYDDLMSAVRCPRRTFRISCSPRLILSKGPRSHSWRIQI